MPTEQLRHRSGRMGSNHLRPKLGGLQPPCTPRAQPMVGVAGHRSSTGEKDRTSGARFGDRRSTTVLRPFGSASRRKAAEDRELESQGGSSISLATSPGTLTGSSPSRKAEESNPRDTMPASGFQDRLAPAGRNLPLALTPSGLRYNSIRSSHGSSQLNFQWRRTRHETHHEGC